MHLKAISTLTEGVLRTISKNFADNNYKHQIKIIPSQVSSHCMGSLNAEFCGMIAHITAYKKSKLVTVTYIALPLYMHITLNICI